MDPEELRKKALSILVKYNTIDSIDWLLENHWDLVEIDHIDEFNSEDLYDSKKIEGLKLGIIIKYESKTYELYYLNETSFYAGDELSYYGHFKLFYEDSLVIHTTYSAWYDQWDSGKSVDWDFKSIKVLKLGDWIEEIPKIVPYQKKLIKLEEKKELEDSKNKFKKDTEDNFDLGNYS